MLSVPNAGPSSPGVNCPAASDQLSATVGTANKTDKSVSPTKQRLLRGSPRGGLLVTMGQRVFAPADGQVWFSGKVVNRSLLSLSHAGGYLSEFEPLCSELKRGEVVFKGQEIGQVCKAEASYVPHSASATCLHFSLRSFGSYLSPLVLIGELNPSRLLPLKN